MTGLTSIARGAVQSIRKHWSPRRRAQRSLATSMSLFREEYDAYWSRIKSDRTLTDMQAEFDAIKKDGCFLAENFLDPQTLQNVKAEVDAIPGFSDGTYSGSMPFSNKESDGLCSLGITEALPLCHSLTVGNERLHSFARALFGPEVRLSAASVLSKYNPDRVDSSEAPHWDDWRVRFKVFIYLTDVTEDTAPTIYMRGSIQGVPWRLEKDFASVFLPIASAGGSWWPVEQLGLEKVTCTGKAGSALLFDALGIHAGSQLRKGKRIMLMSMYTTHLPFTHRVY